MIPPASGGLEGLEGVRAAYGDRTVLHGLDLAVAPGELLVVLGPSGSGKSTLLRVIAGLEPVTGGRVRLSGRDVTRLRPGRRNVSMVFQTYALFPHLTARDNIGFGLVVRDMPRASANAAIEEAARAAGCRDVLDRRPGHGAAAPPEPSRGRHARVVVVLPGAVPEIAYGLCGCGCSIRSTAR